MKTFKINLQLFVNTNMDILYPEVWASELDSLNMGDYPLSQLVSNRNELGAGRPGQIVNVPLSADLGEADVYTDGSTPIITSIAQQQVQVTLNKSYSKGITLSSGDLTLSPYDLIKSYMPGMVRACLRQIDLDIYKAGLLSNYIVDGRTTFNEDSIVSAYQILDENEIQTNGRVLVAGPSDYASMLKFAAFTHADISGANAMATGKIPMRYGFDIYKATIQGLYTPADLTGAINNAGNYTSSDYTLVVNGFNDDTNPVRVGDIFTVADETGAPIHTVQSTTTTNSDTTGITFLTKHDNTNEAKLHTKVITVDPTRSLLAMVPGAIAFASKPYANLDSNIGVKSMTVDIKPGANGNRGVQGRLSVWQEGLSVKVSLDVLYGVSIVDRARVVRIITD